MMESPSPARKIAVDSQSEKIPAASNAKLRLMCSYGGHIGPRPNGKSLCYVGGETRIVAVDRGSTAAGGFADFAAHLSRTVFNNRQFALKYQVPNEDLDSLISVTTDEDLRNMLDEIDGVGSSPKPSRIRLFLFPSKAESVGLGLLDPKSESWFCDALKNTKFMQTGQSAGETGLVSGLMDLDCFGTSDSSNSGEAKHGVDLSSMPESLVLETSSSFGSTGSSISMSNLPSIGAHGEDGGGTSLFDRKVKVPSSSSVESDNTTATGFPQPRIGNYQDPFVHVASMGTTVTRETVETESLVTDPSSGIQFVKPIQVPGPGYQFIPQMDQRQHPQDVQCVQTGIHYVPQFATGQLPPSSYYPIHHLPLHQQHQGYYPPNPPYPIYLLPVKQPQPFNMNLQHNLIETGGAVASNQVPLQAWASELPGKDYRTVLETTPPVTAKPQQSVSPPELHHPSPPVAVPSTAAAANYDNDFDDNIEYNQIYKTQPHAPALPLQYQTMTKATAVLSETSKPFQTELIKQQIGAPPPQ